MDSIRNQIFYYAKKKYKTTPEYLWRRFPNYAVHRHSDNNKWCGLIMDVQRDWLGLDGDGLVDILNVKLRDPLLLICSCNNRVILNVTASKQRKQKDRPPKEWIIPANPKYYDIEHAFDNAEEIDWKQGNGIKAGDIVFLYVAAPVSAILYKCKVTVADIPYKWNAGKALMNK